LVGMVAVACLMIGAVWPWLTAPGGPYGQPPSPVMLWLTVLAGAATIVLALTRPRLVPIALALVVVGAAAAWLTAEPSWMCWDGVDAEGNMVGGCEEDEWTAIPFVFAAGVVLSL